MRAETVWNHNKNVGLEINAAINKYTFVYRQQNQDIITAEKHFIKQRNEMGENKKDWEARD
jgi:hypothetical protein